MVSPNGDTSSCTSRVSLEKLNKNLHRHLSRVAPVGSPVGVALRVLVNYKGTQMKSQGVEPRGYPMVIHIVFH